MKKQCVSISGGLTSHKMARELIDIYGASNVELIFCDTGAEHQGTYDFVRDTQRIYGVDITCIRMSLSKEEGVGGIPVLVPIEDIKPDFKAFNELMAKYGRPFNPGGKFCTNEMKTMIFRKYCNGKYGAGNYNTWIGYRADPKDCSRVWGHTISGSLSKWFNIPKRDQGEFYKDCVDAMRESTGVLFDFISEHITKPIKNHKKALAVFNRVITNEQLGYKFMFEIDNSEKIDVLDYWDKQEFKLKIPKHCGNCVFCIEKTINQLSYLCHTQNELALEWLAIVRSPDIAKKDRKIDENAMYRNGPRKMSFQEVYDEAMAETLEYWESRVKDEIQLSPCAGSGECGIYEND